MELKTKSTGPRQRDTETAGLVQSVTANVQFRAWLIKWKHTYRMRDLAGAKSLV